MSAPFGGSQGVFDTMVQFFKEDEWNYRQLEGKPVLIMGFKGDNGTWQCYAQAREEQSQFVFYSVPSTNVPTEKRPAVAEFLTRANYGMVMGNFELDYSDGQVRFKTSLDVKDNEDRLCTGLIKRLVYINVLMMDKYLPGIMSILYAGTSPSEAIAKIEG